MNTKSFIGVTAHFEHKAELISTNLAVSEMNTEHTGINIRNLLFEVCKEWAIPVSKVTDNAANMVLAVELFVGK